MDIDQSHSLLFARPFWLHSREDDSLMKEYCRQVDLYDNSFQEVLTILKNIKDIQISLTDKNLKNYGMIDKQEKSEGEQQGYAQAIERTAESAQQDQLINKREEEKDMQRLERQLINILKHVEQERKQEIQKFYDGKRHSSNQWNYFVRVNGIFQNMQYVDNLEAIYLIYKVSNLFQTEILQDNTISQYFDNNNTAYSIFSRYYHFFMTINTVNEEYLDKIVFTDDMAIRINIKKSSIEDIISRQDNNNNQQLTSYALTKMLLHKQNGITLAYSDYNHSFLRLLLAVIYLRTKSQKKIWRQLRAVCVWRHRDNVAKHKKFRVHFAGEQTAEASIPTEYFNYLKQIRDEGFDTAQNAEIEECLSYHQVHWPDENDFPKMKGSFFELIHNFIQNVKHIFPSFLIRIMTLVEHGINQEIYARSQQIEQDLQIGQQLQVKISQIIQEMTDCFTDETKFYYTQIIAWEIPEIPEKVNPYQEILQTLCNNLIFEKGFYRRNLGWYLFSKDANKRAKQQQIMEIINKIHTRKELYYIGVQIYSDYIYNFESGYTIETIKKIIEMIEYCAHKKNLISRNFNFKCLEILVERFALDKEMKLRLSYLINNCILVVNQKNKDKVNISSLIELRAPLFSQALFEFLDSIEISPEYIQQFPQQLIQIILQQVNKFIIQIQMLIYKKQQIKIYKKQHLQRYINKNIKINRIGVQYKDFSKRWILSTSSQLLLQIANNRATITEDDIRGILERFSRFFTEKRINEFQIALNEIMPKELLHKSVLQIAYIMLKEEQDKKDKLKKQFLYGLIKYFIPMQKVLEPPFLNELKNDAAVVTERYLLKALVVITQKFEFEHVTANMLTIMLQNKKMDLNLLLRNSRNSADLNQIFLNIKNASILKAKYINKKETIRDIIQLQPSNLKGEVLLLLQPMSSLFLQNLLSAIRQVYKEHQPYVSKQAQLLALTYKSKNYELNLKKCEKSITILKHQQDTVQQLIELLLSQEHQINDVISFITVYTELLYKETKTRVAFYTLFIKQCLPYLRVALEERYKIYPIFNVNNSPLIKQIEAIEDDKTDILIQQYLHIKCNSLDYLLQIIEHLGQHSNLNLKMNYFSTFNELLECEISNRVFDSKQVKCLSRYLICKRETVSYENIFQTFDIIFQSFKDKSLDTKSSLFIHDIGLCILTLALKIFGHQQHKNQNGSIDQQLPESQKVLKTIDLILQICPNERRFYSMMSFILDSQLQTDSKFIRANIELRLKNHFFESNSFVYNALTIVEFSKKIAEVDLYQYPNEYFDILTSLFTYNSKDSTVKLIENVIPEFQFTEFGGDSDGVFEDILEKLVKTQNDFYLCFIAELCRKYPTYLKNLVQWKYSDTKDIFDFILENMIGYNYNLGVYLNLLCNQNYSFYMLETGLIQGSSGYIVPTLISRTLDFISKCDINSEKAAFTLQGVLNILKYLKPKFTYLDHLKLIVSFIEFVGKQKSLQKLTLLERLGVFIEIQASLKIASSSELGDYKHAKYFFFRNVKTFLTEENRIKSEQFTKELKEKLSYNRNQDNFNLPILSSAPSQSSMNDQSKKPSLPVNLETGLKLRYFSDKMNNKIPITYPREDLATYEQDLMKYNLDFSESDEIGVIQFISSIKKNHRAFDGIDGDAAFKRVVLETLDISTLTENDKKLETIISSIFKLSSKAKGSKPHSYTKICQEGKEVKPDNSSLVQELDEKLKSFKKIKDKLEQESAANQRQQQQEKAGEEPNGLIEDLEEQQKVLEQQKQDLIKQYEALLQDSMKQSNLMKKFSADLTNHKKPVRRQFQFDSFNFPANSLQLYQIDEEVFYNSSHNEKIRMLNEGKQSLHYKNILKKLKISVLRESYSIEKLIAKFKNEKFALQLDLKSQFDANFESFMTICNEHEKMALLLSFDQRYLKQLPEKWKTEALRIRKQHMNKGVDIKLQESEEEEEKNAKEEEKDLPGRAGLIRPTKQNHSVAKKYVNMRSYQSQKYQAENDENSLQNQDINDEDDDEDGDMMPHEFQEQGINECIDGMEQMSIRNASMKQKQKTSIEVDLVSNEIASMRQMSVEMQKQIQDIANDNSPQMITNLKNRDLSSYSYQIESSNKIEQSNSLIDSSHKQDFNNDSLSSNILQQNELQSDTVLNVLKQKEEEENNGESKINDEQKKEDNPSKEDKPLKEDSEPKKNESSLQEKMNEDISEVEELLKKQTALQKEQQKLLQQQIEEQERVARQIYEQEQELANNQKDDYFDYDDFDALNQQIILDQIAKEREDREIKKQQLQDEQNKKAEYPDKLNSSPNQEQAQEPQLSQEEKYLQSNFSQSLPYSAEKEKKYSQIDFFLKSLYVDSSFLLNVLRLLINRGLDEFQEYQNSYLEILYIISFNPFNNYKVVQLLKGITSSIILDTLLDKHMEVKIRSHYLKYQFKYESDQGRANNQQCYNVFQLTQALLDYEIFNWYYFILKVDQDNPNEERFNWNYSILEKNMKGEESKVQLSIRSTDVQGDVMRLNSHQYSLIALLEHNVNSILKTQQIIERSDDYSVSITQLRQNYDATFNLILKYLGKFNMTTNVYRKTAKTDAKSATNIVSQETISNVDKNYPSISVETYPEMKYQINISNSFFEAYYTYSFHLKGSRKTSLKKMNNILYDLLRKKMVENYESFEDMSLQILKINREVLYNQIVSCNQFVKNYKKLTQDSNHLKNLNGTEEIAQQKRYIFHQIMEKNYENMSFQLGTLRRTIKNLTEIFNEMFEIQWKLDLEKEYEVRKQVDGEQLANEWLKKQKKELRQELLSRLEQYWMNQLKDLYVLIYEILYHSIQLMSEKLDSSKFTYDRFNLSVKSVVVLYDFFHQDDTQFNLTEDKGEGESHHAHIHSFKEPLLQKLSSKDLVKSQNHVGDDNNSNLNGALNKQFSQVLNTNLDQITISDLYFIIEQKFIGLIVLFIETSDRKKKWLEFMKKVGNLKIKEEKSLTMEFKMSYLKIVCEIEAKKKKKNKDYGFDYYGDFQPEIRFNINRDEVWMSTIAELSKQDAASLVHQQLIISFEGEAGIDQGGMAREWINLALKDVLDPRKGLFALSSNKITLQPSPLSHIVPDHLVHFRFAGRLVGIALTNKIDFEIDLTRSFLKHILKKQLYIHDFEDIDSATSKNLLWMLENEVKGSDLTYSIHQDLLGVLGEVDLTENGKNIEINETNKQQFVTDYVHYKMTLEIKQQLESFISGFYDVVHPSALIFFDERDLGLRLAGSKKIDIEDMKKNTKYSGNYDQDSPQIKWIWQVLEQFDEEMKQSFIFFLTGAFKVPFGGFEQNPIEIYDKLGNTNSLPIAHTCFNKLELPVYSTKEQLEEKLTKAILEGHKGFHIS